MPDDEQQEQPEARGPRALWSGTISFGLVSIPVELYPATRTERFALRTLSPDGRPLRREFFCPDHGEPVSGEDIVRGFNVGDGQYVVVTDEELEGLAPDKSRDIDLRRFVPRHELPMANFERAHFMAPTSDSNKAYRLLTKTLEETDRIGIATFVMRGKEYLVAIIAERGLLRAETLRFADEIRTPADIGLPTRTEPSSERLQQVRRACKALRKSKLDLDEHTDAGLQRARALVEDKLRRHQDVVVKVQEPTGTGDGGAEIIDLFEVLKRSLQNAQTPADDSTSKPGAGSTRAKRQSAVPKSKLRKTTARKAEEKQSASATEPAKWTKKELYDRAQDLDIAGRSQMTKPQLAKAIRRATESERKAG